MASHRVYADPRRVLTVRCDDAQGGRRNCGPPGHAQAQGTLLLRQVLGTAAMRRCCALLCRASVRQVLPSGLHALGEIFWAAEHAPAEWAVASAALGFRALGEMDPQTRADVAALGPQAGAKPCANGTASGVFKCEACAGGCQLWDDVPHELYDAIGNERAHFERPGGDTLLYRSGEVGFVYASTRGADRSQGAWGAPVLTNIPNDESNINAGTLPDGRIWFLNNPVFRPKHGSADTLRFRDPVTLIA